MKKLNKTVTVSITVALILAMATIGFANATPRLMKECNMLYSTSENPDKWLPVPGNQVSGFKLTLDDSVEWYYLDIKFIKPKLPAGSYQFFLEPPEDEAFLTYWANKGVDESSLGGWEWIMWRIIHGGEIPYPPYNAIGQFPMFALYSYGDGTYDLIDSLTFFASLPSIVLSPLRLNGDYPKGTYTFTCNLVAQIAGYPAPEGNMLDGVSMTITFR